MMNVMTFEGGYKATIVYDPEIEMFRGEFFGLNGGADFYAKDTEGLKREGAISLHVFLDMCEKDEVPPRNDFKELALHLEPEIYHQAGLAAKAKGLGLNQWISQVIEDASGV